MQAPQGLMRTINRTLRGVTLTSPDEIFFKQTQLLISSPLRQLNEYFIGQILYPS
uniref:Uncharacterized protein n=1 Tax=Hippocampus comes TaxID=109280 RepID=A0A3Q2XZL0_HIPCM